VLEPGEGASVRLLADGPGVLDARELLRGLSLAERDLRAAAPRPDEDGRDPHHTGGA
jgi:hypothetical protein